MRIKNSTKNIYISVLTQVVMVLLGFLSRKVFLDNLGEEYLGVNGLLNNILSMLSLVEGGIGTSIIYNLYSPLAENDIKKTTALIQLYKKIYRILAIVILILSTIIYMFLGKFIKGGTTIPFIGVVYFIFVFNNVISYLNAHKWSLINADQKGYVIAKYNLIFSITSTITKIIILYMTKNYILFLLIDSVIFMVQNIYNGKIVTDRYSYIKTKEVYKVDEETKLNLITNVKAIFLHNIGTYCVFGTDNILISTFVGIKTVGLYSNYTMITTQLSSLLTPVLNGIGASVGNLIATEGKEKVYQIFKVTYLINFWIYSLSVILLYNLLEPFINWWLGEGLILDYSTFIVILINFYITGLRTSVNIFKAKSGIFKDDQFLPLIESIINLGASLILVKKLGLVGIFIGTTISTISIPIWTQSKLVYNKIFEKSSVEYFKKYIFYIFLTVITGYVATSICSIIIDSNSFIDIVLKGLICFIVVNLIYVLVFYKTEEFEYIYDLVKSLIIRRSNKNESKCNYNSV